MVASNESWILNPVYIYSICKKIILKAIIFDLDGTLLNTLDDLADCMNRVLHHHGYPSYPVEQYKLFVGEGIYSLVKKAVNPFTQNQIKIDSMFEEMKEEYKKNWNKKTKPYETMIDVLSELKKAGILLSILSNKPEPLAKITVRYFFPKISFFHVQGALDTIPQKPDPTGALAMIKKANLPKKEFILIGDSSVDMATAKNASIYPAGVLWGFRGKEELIKYGAKHIFKHPKEILPFLILSN
jgi:phosphoglycolate phosphatase